MRVSSTNQVYSFLRVISVSLMHDRDCVEIYIRSNHGHTVIFHICPEVLHSQDAQNRGYDVSER